MAEEPGEDPKADPKGLQDPSFKQELRGLILDVISELDGKEQGKAPDKEPDTAEPERPKTNRQVEESMREQVAAAVAELKGRESHDKEHEELRRTAQPPQPEHKPWRHRLWGE